MKTWAATHFISGSLADKASASILRECQALVVRGLSRKNAKRGIRTFSRGFHRAIPLRRTPRDRIWKPSKLSKKRIFFKQPGKSDTVAFREQKPNRACQPTSSSYFRKYPRGDVDSSLLHSPAAVSSDTLKKCIARAPNCLGQAANCPTRAPNPDEQRWSGALSFNTLRALTSGE